MVFWICISQFVASVRIDLHLKQIFDAIKSFLKGIGDVAQKALDTAKEKVAGAQEYLSYADTKLSGWQNKMTAYQNSLRERSAEIERQKKAMEYSCKQRCGKGSVNLPVLDSQNSR